MRLFRNKNIRLLSFFIAVSFALPISLGTLTGFYTWLSPYLMLNSVFYLKSVVWLNIFGFSVLLISLTRKRWFCRYICPLGEVCDIVSKLSWRKQYKTNKIPLIGRWLAILSLAASLIGLPLLIIFDPISIFNGFFLIFSANNSIPILLSYLLMPILIVIHLFFPNIWCARLCPLGGLQNDVYILKQWITNSISQKKLNETVITERRRFFIASGIGLMAGLIIPKFLHPPRKIFFRPPGSISFNDFNMLCTRCGSCIKACPTDIIIPHIGNTDPLAWMTPEVSFEKGSYCLENCNLCGNVCPSGSITPFSINAKKQLVMGLAKIYLENCLLTKGSECDRCKASCHFDAINYKRTNSLLTAIPVINTDLCVGCGACFIICPEKTIEIVVV